MVSVDATGPLDAVIVTEVGDKLDEIPSVAELLADRLMVPTKPFRPVKVMMEVPFVAPLTEREVGAALALKSGGGTVIVILKLCDKAPLVPITLMV